MSQFSRPLLDVAGSVVARRELKMGDRVYVAGETLSAEDRAQLTDRQLATMWQMGLIDTPAREVSDADLERLTAPAPPAAKQQPRR